MPKAVKQETRNDDWRRKHDPTWRKPREKLEVSAYEPKAPRLLNRLCYDSADQPTCSDYTLDTNDDLSIAYLEACGFIEQVDGYDVKPGRYRVRATLAGRKACLARLRSLYRAAAETAIRMHVATDGPDLLGKVRAIAGPDASPFAMLAAVKTATAQHFAMRAAAREASRTARLAAALQDPEARAFFAEVESLRARGLLDRDDDSEPTESPEGLAA